MATGTADQWRRRASAWRQTAVAALVAAAVWSGGGLPARAADVEPVARWGFDAEETSRLVSHGGVHRDEPGPRPPEFPDADPGNLAVRLDGAGSHFAFADPGARSPLDFANGDAITLEAWVNLADLKRNENAYVVSKGRTGAAGFAKDNQNWALRVREENGQARVSFLFATPPAGKGVDGTKGAGAKVATADDAVAKGVAAKGAHWHRWTTTAGFPAVGQWHHVAVGYRFGDPDSVRGWVDGKPTGGGWDMGGPTREPPVVD
ncbi:MAG: Planctomycete cytochrome, partial [Phycisphaerales bacterium]|nr:Planctomycete cytochrome [Phycisphaerales bacterium]